MCVWPSDSLGGQSQAFVPCSSLAVANFAVGKNLSRGFVAQASNMDTFSF